jgi:hypothetical protein
MAQTPARDIIKTAEVDFRFYGGDVRNYANNANVLAGIGFTPVFQAAHGVPALTYAANPADQAWMLAAQTAVTIEVLLSLDMLHLGATVGSEAANTRILAGDWQLGFMTSPGAGEATSTCLWASFSGETFGGAGFYIKQELSEDVLISMQKGSPLHVVLSVEYDSIAPTYDVTTCINGVVSTATTASANFTMTAAPTNTIFDSAVQCPVYLLRMWDTYQADALVLADLYREARKVLPMSSFPTPTGDVTLYAPA